MAVLLYSEQPPKNSNTPIIVVAVIVLAVVLLGGVFAFAFYTPTIFRSSSSNGLQDPRVSSATLVCTGTCDFTAQFYSDVTGQTGQIAQNGPGAWMLQRPSNAVYWNIEWRIALSSTGSVTISLNTGYVILQLQGPTSNQGSWTTSTGQY